MAFVSWFTPKPEGQVTVPSFPGPSLSVSLWLGLLLFCVCYVHTVSLSFNPSPLGTQKLTHLHLFKDTLFKLWVDFEGLGFLVGPLAREGLRQSGPEFWGQAHFLQAREGEQTICPGVSSRAPALCSQIRKQGARALSASQPSPQIFTAPGEVS